MNTTRNTAIDIIRGVTLISMIAYHTLWDLVYIFGHEEIGSWYASAAGFVWQQSICCTFIILAGYCTNLGRRTLRRGLTVFTCGLVIMAVSAVAMPEARVVYGVLTLIGTGMVIAGVAARGTGPSQSASLTALPKGEPRLDSLPASLTASQGADAPSASKRTRQLSPGELTPEGEPRLIRDSLATPERAAMPSFIILLALFAVTYRINEGYLLLPFAGRIALPDALYANLLTAYLGFPPEGFFSTDYFSLLPWLFLFFAGRALYRVMARHRPSQSASLTASQGADAINASERTRQLSPGELTPEGEPRLDSLPASLTASRGDDAPEGNSPNPASPSGRGGPSGPERAAFLVPLAFLGRHTLPIYMVHQPVIYGILLLIHL